MIDPPADILARLHVVAAQAVPVPSLDPFFQWAVNQGGAVVVAGVFYWLYRGTAQDIKAERAAREAEATALREKADAEAARLREAHRVEMAGAHAEIVALLQAHRVEVTALRDDIEQLQETRINEIRAVIDVVNGNRTVLDSFLKASGSPGGKS